MTAPVEIFCCYARKDQQLLNDLKAHLMPLQRQGLITLWADTDINAGSEWEKEIEKHLDTAQIILLLVSPDFMKSEYCYSKEMTRAMERHEQGKARVIPVILRPTDWQGTPFHKLQALPKDAKPVTSPSWHDLDEAFSNVAEGIRKVVVRLPLSLANARSETLGKLLEPLQLHPSTVPSQELALKNKTQSGKRISTKKRIPFIAVGLILITTISAFLWKLQDYQPIFSKATVTKTPTTVITTSNSSTDVTSASSLIPNHAPVLNDSLSKPDNPYQWQVGLQGTATCSLFQGTYQIAAAAGSTGGECNTQAESTYFTNFVYQIKMTILQGVGRDAGAGPAFCSNYALNGSFYGLSFNEMGYWSLNVLTNANTPNPKIRMIKSGTSKYFHTNVSQANYITVRVKDHKIDAQINGYPLFPTISDITLNEGTVGVQLDPGPLNSDVAFNDAKVWQL